MQDRRKYPRSRIFKGAKIVLSGSPVIDCLVCNVTNVGAHLQISKIVEIPESFGLTFDGGRTVRSCRVAWRGITEAGVEFV